MTEYAINKTKSDVYYIQKIMPEQAGLPGIWENIPVINIAKYPWDENGYKPRVEAGVFYTDTHLHLRFKAYESKIRAECRDLNDMVCRDSCMEFFFNPNPGNDDRYLNFEINPIGSLLLYIGKDRYGRTPAVTQKDLKAFNILTSVARETLEAYNGPYWEVTWRIPFDYLERYYGKLDFCAGKRMKANFYKCGDKTEFPHYACWNNIVIDTPDFHRPEFFGDLVLA